ncbi:uncharacterized protein CcaverHIS019_0703570 [Cutaneotrichosporon cavernicola]|uniref:Uncharacterized protein n=1 Tax=Cutaneotrichosporon cavernicola TaxID=279322 RepID=A0AA48L9Q4_9TREE|nr:uncharacterized protein CcaverHIS019_0703570 [Cutaneotrichosporon cavernicola]BEI94776.1 hypothetical protein CcaverHIS019_0703570 [Cutaneotrichosporon cavernicola]BEJ02551.1 hypothetical protein CcaverHIS631_0703460 [Cutaneotrichosporon cavernicola]BEJ10308.1 hypothetical protein CcaverHIS641_0703430 [Cutaneotrichosporon cavernicola]
MPITLDPDADPDAPAPHVSPLSDPPPYTPEPLPTLSADARVLARDILALPPGVRAIVLGLCKVPPSPSDDGDSLALAVHYIVRTAAQASHARTVWLRVLNYVILAFWMSLLSYLPVLAAYYLSSPLILGLVGVIHIILLPVAMVGTRFDRLSGGISGVVWLLAGTGPFVGACIPIGAAFGFGVEVQGLLMVLQEGVKVAAAVAAVFGLCTALVLRHIDADVMGYWAMGVHELPTMYEFVTSIVGAGARAYGGGGVD